MNEGGRAALLRPGGDAVEMRVGAEEDGIADDSSEAIGVAIKLVTGQLESPAYGHSE